MCQYDDYCSADMPCPTHRIEELDSLLDAANARLDSVSSHSGQCVQCGRWTCGLCGMTNSEGEWRCEVCHHGSHVCNATEQVEAANARVAELEAQLESRKLKWQTGKLPGYGYYLRWLKGSKRGEVVLIEDEEDSDYISEHFKWAGPIEPPEEEV